MRGGRYRGLSSERDIRLDLALSTLNAAGLAVRPRLQMQGVEVLDRALAAGRGALLIAPHMPLLRLAVRHLHDTGRPVTAVTGIAPQRAAGSHSSVPTLPVSSTFLLGARDALRRGEIVFAMIDRLESASGRTVPVALNGTTFHVADPLIRLAARCGAPVLFAGARVHGRGVSCMITPPGDGLDPEMMTRDFIAFVQDCALRVEGGQSNHTSGA